MNTLNPLSPSVESIPASPSAPVVERIEEDWRTANPELVADWEWALETRQQGGFAGYPAECIAIFNRKVLGSDWDQQRLRHNWADNLKVHPEGIVILCLA